MIFIPFGIDEKDQNKYELTQYINDVTTKNTQVLMEYSNESGITAYSYGNERLSYETNGVNYKYNYDGRGSVTNLLDNTNTSVVEYNYQPFGETEVIGTKAQELENTYQFNAESTDKLTGLQYLRARYYDSKTGRFTSKDTYLGEITDPLSRNLYLYTQNDPVNFIDPSGHSIFSLISSAVQNVVNTVKNVAKKVVSVAKKVVSAVPKVLDTVSQVVRKRMNIQPELPDISSVMREAAVKVKVEKAKALEQQIKTYRAMNIKEADEIANILEEQMILLCEDRLDRVAEQKAADRIAAVAAVGVLEKMKKSNDQALSAVIGFGTTLVTDTIEFFGGVIEGGASLIYAGDFWYGYNKFKEETVIPMTQAYRDMAPDKDTYDFGTGLATGFEIFEAGRGIVKLTSKGVTKIAGKIKGTPSSPIKADIGKVKTVEAGSGTSKITGGSGADDIIQYERLRSQYAAEEIYNADRVGSALKDDPTHRAASYLSKEQLADGRTYTYKGGDNRTYTLLQTEGQLNNVDGIFEYIVNDKGQVTHQRFIQGGKYTGFPNQKIPKGGN